MLTHLLAHQQPSARDRLRSLPPGRDPEASPGRPGDQARPFAELVPVRARVRVPELASDPLVRGLGPAERGPRQGWSVHTPAQLHCRPLPQHQRRVPDRMRRVARVDAVGCG